MIGFDKFKYPLDHKWIDKLNNSDWANTHYYLFDTYYEIQCEVCNLFIRHEDRNILSYNGVIDYFVALNPMNYDGNPIIRFNNRKDIDFSKIYSCKEMLIKNIIE